MWSLGIAELTRADFFPHIIDEIEYRLSTTDARNNTMNA